MSDNNFPISPLVADLMTASLTETARITEQVIDDLQKQNRELRATIDAIRVVVFALVEGDYIPTPRTIVDALYPPHETVAKFLSEDQ